MDIGNKIERLEYFNELLNNHALTVDCRAKAIGKVIDICISIMHEMKSERREICND